MAVGEIRAIDRSCRSYRPGHQVHWIQAKKSAEDQQPVIDVAVVVRDDGRWHRRRRTETDNVESRGLRIGQPTGEEPAFCDGGPWSGRTRARLD